ncbi:hypothetical protein EDD15DRAFT_2375331 [Pisolithus albus]|nr:hypothetical protein EDD15DRAFT_2375331 [Pisolithus albus]
MSNLRGSRVYVEGWLTHEVLVFVVRRTLFSAHSPTSFTMRLSSSLGIFLTIALVTASVVPSVRSSYESRVASAPHGAPTSGSHGGVRQPAIGKQAPTPSVEGGKKGSSAPVESSSAGQAAPPEGGFATGFPYQSGEKAPKKGSKSYAPSRGGSPAGGGAVSFVKASQGGSPSKSGDYGVSSSNSTASPSKAAAVPSGYPSKSELGAPASVASSPSWSEATITPIAAAVQPTGTNSGYFSKTENGASSSLTSPSVSTSSSYFKPTLPTQFLSSGDFQPTGSRTGYLPKSGSGTPSAVASPSGTASAFLTEAAVPVQFRTADTKPAELTGSQSGHHPEGYEGPLCVSYSSSSASSTPDSSRSFEPTDLGYSQGAHAEGATTKRPGTSVHRNRGRTFT